ncbi:MAG: hypothetical protein ABMB14_24460 [Myxococcota bacterium]
MSYEEVVIGFDARVPTGRLADGWDDDRRAQFLLGDAPAPLSVDEAVWPRTMTTVSEESLTDGSFEVLTPRFASLEDALAHADPGEVVIGITAWRGPGEPELPAGPAWPMKPDPDWTRLGWDVVSGVFPSALSNCGYGDERDDWRDRWGPELNQNHLFESLPIAFAFRDASNRRVPEHAPLSVLGLYRVR